MKKKRWSVFLLVISILLILIPWIQTQLDVQVIRDTRRPLPRFDRIPAQSKSVPLRAGSHR